MSFSPSPAQIALLPRNAKTGQVLKSVRNVRLVNGFLAYDEKVRNPIVKGDKIQMVYVGTTWCELDSPFANRYGAVETV